MNPFLNRARTNRLPDTTVLRARVMAAVEEAMDRIEDVMHDAPTPREAAGRVLDSRAAEAATANAERVRTSRAGEATATAAAAALPVVVSFLRDRAKSKAALRAARVAPFVFRSNPVLLGASVVGGAALGVAAIRRMRADAAARDEAGGEMSAPARTVLAEEVSRMEGEGGDPGAYDGTPTPLRRFVRAGDEDRTGGH